MVVRKSAGVDANAEKMNCPAQNYAPVLDSVQNDINSYKNNI